MRHLPSIGRVAVVLAVAGLAVPAANAAQDTAPPAMRAGALAEGLAVDGVLDEPAWRVSDSIGINTRLRWTYRPVGDLFVVYNHNVRSLLDRWQLDSNQLLIMMQYAWRL